MADGDFSKQDFDIAFHKKFKELIQNKEPVPAPVTYVLGGQPGAGKTGLQDIMKKKCNDNLVVLNGDEFRELHPDFDRLQEKYGKDSVDYTGKFSGQMTEALIAKLKEEKYNVLVEGTLRTAEVPLKTCREFKAAGYNVVLGVIAVKPQISYLSTILRYEKMIAAGKTPRATAKQNHDNTVKNIPDNLQQIFESKLFDNILIYNRNGDCLYDMSKAPTISPRTIIQETFANKWSQNELSQFVSIGNTAQELMERRNAPELAYFKENVFNEEILSSFPPKHFRALVTESELAKLKQSGIKLVAIPDKKNNSGKYAIRVEAELQEKVKSILRNSHSMKI